MNVQALKRWLIQTRHEDSFLSLEKELSRVYHSTPSNQTGASACNRDRGNYLSGKGITIWFRNWGASRLPSPPKSLYPDSHISLVFDKFSDFHMREIDWCICMCVGRYVLGLGLFCVLYVFMYLYLSNCLLSGLQAEYNDLNRAVLV